MPVDEVQLQDPNVRPLGEISPITLNAVFALVVYLQVE